MLSMIVEKKCFAATLPLIITGAQTDWIDVYPVRFWLRMDNRITVNFAGRGLKHAAFESLGEAKHVDRTVHRCLRGLHGIVLIMDWRCRAGQIVDFIYLHIQGEGHIMTQKFEP